MRSESYALLLACLSCVGCAGKVSPPEPGPEAGTPEDSGTHDADAFINARETGATETGAIDADRDADGDIDAGPPCAPITGSAPFGIRLGGTGPVTDAGFGGTPPTTVNAAVDVYFPKGRVPGGEVVLSVGNYGGGSTISYGILDSTLSAYGLRAADAHCGSGFTGALVGPTDGIVGVAFNNTSAPSDAITMISGPVKMCAVGPVPEQKLDPPLPSVVPPFDALVIRGSRPFARDTFASITASADAGALTIKVTEGDPGVRIGEAPYMTPVFSLFAPTTFQLAGLRDVLGGGLGLTTVKTVVPTTAVTDLGFSTAPPASSYVGDPVAIVSGALQVGNTGTPTYSTVALSIEVPAGKTIARLRHRVVCPFGGSGGTWSVGVVTPGATSTRLDPMCSTAMIDETITLPATGPYVLLVSGGRPRVPPCNYPGFSPPSAYELDQVTFE